jgi:hypothetical protein
MMQASFGANIDSARVLTDALRDAIENTVTDRDKRRLLLLLDAIAGELRLTTALPRPTASRRSRVGDALDAREAQPPTGGRRGRRH